MLFDRSNFLPANLIFADKPVYTLYIFQRVARRSKEEKLKIITELELRETMDVSLIRKCKSGPYGWRYIFRNRKGHYKRVKSIDNLSYRKSSRFKSSWRWGLRYGI
jgi:hypothetical protein